MDQQHLAALFRSVVRLPSRRDLLRGLAGGGLTAYVGWPLSPPEVAAKNKEHKKRKKKKKKKKPLPLPPLPLPTLNAFGCVDVGQACRGDSALCCSGICQGTPPQPGQLDLSVCVGHDAGICIPGSNICTLDGTAQCGSCNCVGTTGNATFCGDTSGVAAQETCRVCSKDTDCQVEFGPGAACIYLEGLCSIYCADTGYTACVRPCA